MAVKRVIGNIHEEIVGIEKDSRLVKKGDCFVCIKGYTVDGHNFVEEVIEKGAKVIVVEDMPAILNENVVYVQVENSEKALAVLANNFYNFPSKSVRSIGVTGTNGKTTVANMVNDGFKVIGENTAIMGTLGININGEKMETQNTTSDVLTIQKSYKKMVEKNVGNAVLEVSSHGLSLGRLEGVEFQTAIMTNLTQDHLDFHKTMENYASAKGKLFSSLGNDITNNQIAILNKDDEYYGFFKSKTSAKIVTYGIKNDADLMAKNIVYSPNSTKFTLVTKDKAFEITTNFIGEFNVYNTLAAIGAFLDKGVSYPEIIKIFQMISPVDGRMELVKNKLGLKIYIDYAHTPDGIEKALRSLKNVTTGRLICLIGAGGNRDKEKRPIMARKASENSDFVFITTDNPRDETYDSIMNDMVAGMTHESFRTIGDRRKAIYECLKTAKMGDTVIIAGKGPENFQIVKGEKIPFNDKKVVIKYLNQKK